MPLYIPWDHRVFIKHLCVPRTCKVSASILEAHHNSSQGTFPSQQPVLFLLGTVMKRPESLHFHALLSWAPLGKSEAPQESDSWLQALGAHHPFQFSDPPPAQVVG